MDREIAAGCFDRKMMIFDFRFRNFTHNIPPAEDSIDSDRTSNIDKTLQESTISLIEIDEEAELPSIRLEQASAEEWS